MSTWKHAERVIASLVGGRRVPINGRGDEADIEHSWLAIEVKHRKSFPKWLQKAHLQAEGASITHKLGPKQSLPIVIVHPKGWDYRDSLVQIRLSDFIDWFGDHGGR